MATNEVFEDADHIYGAVPVGTLSGDPVVLGQIPGVAQIDRDSSGKATIARRGMHKLTVNGVDGGGNSAVAAGDILYHTQADTIKLSKKATGVRFGYAGPDQAITSGASAIIDVIVGY
jgi:predicted RecA/RadA family phage recombinase